ncbi:LamG-like jellyroll fold domain-containing protein [Aeromonas veronii]|uniref:LamG-like jellyroll fold domain-containing protein n=2 Tax=Aeromonas veronii TaxID=654 RepID=UPI003F791DBF
MATLYDTIKAANPIAFWPLGDNKDHSGNNRHLVAHGSPAFSQPAMNSDLLPSMQTGNLNAALRIEQSTLPKIVSIEGWFRLAGAKGSGIYSTVFGLNQPLTGFNSRYIMFYHETLGFCSYQNITSVNQPVTYRSAKTWELLSSGSHHVVMQYEAASNSTKIYIDGVLDAGMTVPLDVFMQLANTYLAIGGYYYDGNVTGNCQLSHVAIYGRELTQEEITSRQSFVIGDPDFKPPVRITAVAANQEPRSQFQPQDVAWRGTPPLYPGPVNLQQQTQHPLCKGRDYFWIRDGVRNVEQGYIESTVTISGVGVRRRVLCFTQDGELVGETYSRASDGVYRFDLLWLNKRYMLVAQDDPAFGPADYNAVAADYQAPKPYPPGGGVAPAPFPMLAPLKRK